MEQFREELSKPIDIQEASIACQDIIDIGTNKTLEVSDNLYEDTLDAIEDGGQIVHGARRGIEAL